MASLRPAGDRSMELTDDDVLEILKLFEQSTFDFLELQQGDRKITVSKGGHVRAGSSATPAPVMTASASAAASAAKVAPSSTASQPASKAQAAPADAGLVPVTAPMVGKFYAAASPADPPYV